MNGPMLSTTAPDPGKQEIRPIQTAPPPQTFPPPVQESAEVFADDRIVDPIDQAVPSMPTHATMQDFAPPPGELAVAHGEEAQFTAILQGLLSNMGTDPLAVEKNVSLATQYVDAVQKKVAERRAEEIRKQEEMEQKLMEEALNTNALGPYLKPLRPPMGPFVNPLTGQVQNPALFKDDDDAFIETQDLAAPQAAPSEERKDDEPSTGPARADGPEGGDAQSS